jgi:hypothetical protein
MDWLDKTTIQLGAQVTSTLVALLALFIGLRNEARNQKRFERQLSLSQQAASAAARPLLLSAKVTPQISLNNNVDFCRWRSLGDRRN